LAIMAKIGFGESRMQTLTAKDAKYAFGRLIDLARTAPVAVAKHGRPVVVVMAIEEYERLKRSRSARGKGAGDRIRDNSSGNRRGQHR
jgi:prevent-host-death family protein